MVRDKDHQNNRAWSSGRGRRALGGARDITDNGHIIPHWRSPKWKRVLLILAETSSTTNFTLAFNMDIYAKDIKKPKPALFSNIKVNYYYYCLVVVDSLLLILSQYSSNIIIKIL